MGIYQRDIAVAALARGNLFCRLEYTLCDKTVFKNEVINQMVGNILSAVWEFAENALSVVLSFFSSLLGHLFNGLITVLKFIFQPIFILVGILFYFVSKLSEIFLLLITVLVSIGKLFYSFVQGFIKTIAGFLWSPAPQNHGTWSGAINEAFIALEPYQLDKIAYILMFVIWFLTAYRAIRMLSSRGDA